MRFYPFCLSLLFLFTGIAHSLSGQQPDSAYLHDLEKHRETYLQNFLQHEDGPLTADEVTLVDFFDPAPAYRVEASFTRTPEAEPFDMATYSGITKPYVQYGLLEFELNQDTFQLAIYQSLRLRQLPMYREYLFLPFMDATNGDMSYGGGRYMDFTISSIREGKLSIDFNKAYNPYCAYSDGYNCPIPPTINHLPIEIPAGEKAFNREKE